MGFGGDESSCTGDFCVCGAGDAGGRCGAGRTRGNLHAEAGQIFALDNQVRAQAGVGRLDWDPALADAALQHCLRMAAKPGRSRTNTTASRT